MALVSDLSRIEKLNNIRFSYFIKDSELETKILALIEKFVKNLIEICETNFSVISADFEDNYNYNYTEVYYITLENNIPKLVDKFCDNTFRLEIEPHEMASPDILAYDIFDDLSHLVVFQDGDIEIMKFHNLYKELVYLPLSVSQYDVTHYDIKKEDLILIDSILYNGKIVDLYIDEEVKNKNACICCVGYSKDDNLYYCVDYVPNGKRFRIVDYNNITFTNLLPVYLLCKYYY